MIQFRYEILSDILLSLCLPLSNRYSPFDTLNHPDRSSILSPSDVDLIIFDISFILLSFNPYSSICLSKTSIVASISFVASWCPEGSL